MQKQNTQNMQQKTQWKGIFIGGLVLLGIGYLASVILTTKESTPASSVSIISSETRNPVSASAILIKEESTLASSGTETKLPPCNLVNPFSGATDCKKEEKPKFVKPNTEWKTRTLNINGKWITYEFGKGQPEGAKPLSDEEREVYKKCYYNTVVNALDCPPPPGTVAITMGYLTADTEKDILTLVKNPLWEKVLTNCEQQFRQYEDPTGIVNAGTGGNVSYDTMLNGSGLSIDNLLLIDDRTGRKEIVLNNLMNWFSPILRGAEPRVGDNPIDVSKINNCITQNGGIELYRTMDNLNQRMYYPD